MKFIGYRTLKTGIGAAAAMVIAKELGLQYSVSAGIIAILSIQSTRKQSFQIALERIVACVLSLLIAVVTFKVFGYNEITFGLFLMIFIFIAAKLNVAQGIVVNSVLVTHLLLEKSVSPLVMGNELSLMLVGTGVALILNLYMPSIEDQIKEDQIYIESKIKEILLHMAVALKEQYVSIKEEELYKNLESRLDLARGRAYRDLNNYFFTKESYYVEYMEMRIIQFDTMKRMRLHFQRFFMTYEQTIMMANFTEEVANSLHENNTAEGLINDLNLLRDSFRKTELPATREEFENRAELLQFLNDMEQFLEIKYEFKKRIVKK